MDFIYAAQNFDAVTVVIPIRSHQKFPSPSLSSLKLIGREPKYSYLATIWYRFFTVPVVFFSPRFYLVYWPKPQKSQLLSGARLELVDDDGDWRELRKNGWHRSDVLTSQMMK
jgi:hypothetical protein